MLVAHARHPGRSPRTAFTVVEILIVVTIIAVLVALTVVAVNPFISGQSQNTTENVLRKLDTALEQHWTEVRKRAEAETIPPAILTMAGNDQRRAKVIWVKLRLRQEFPMCYAEILQPWVPPTDFGVTNSYFGANELPAIYSKRLTAAGLIPANNKPETQSSACLLMALTRARKGLIFNPDEALGVSAIKDTDGDGLPEIIDGWGRPIAFFRWGTALTEMDNLKGARTNNLNRDVQDQDLALMSNSWDMAQPQGVTLFRALCHEIRQGNQPFSYYTTPTLVSSGPDEAFGLTVLPGYGNAFDPALRPIANATESLDNLYNFRLR